MNTRLMSLCMMAIALWAIPAIALADAYVYGKGGLAPISVNPLSDCSFHTPAYVHCITSKGKQTLIRFRLHSGPDECTMRLENRGNPMRGDEWYLDPNSGRDRELCAPRRMGSNTFEINPTK